MATLSKPKARINNVGENLHPSPHSDMRNKFVFSEDIQHWIRGKSLAVKNCKPLF
jgi:hypothetical protein